MVSVLRVQGQNKTTWTKIQGKIKDHGSEYKDLNFCEYHYSNPRENLF
jgi:hypothetical protein